MSDRINNAALREAVQARIDAGEVTWSGIARELGFMRPDPVKIRRALGVQASFNGCGHRYHNMTVSYERGVAIAQAAGIDPVEIGA